MRLRLLHKIFLYLILSLLFISFFFSNSILGVTDIPKMDLPINDSIDQYQVLWSHGITVANPDMIAQSFVPEKNVLTRLELLVHKAADPLNNITISIRSSKDGPDLTSVTVSSEYLPLERTWVEFDFPDIHLNLSQSYYIMFIPHSFSMYYFWWGYDNHNFDSYINGEGWLYLDGEWINDGFVIKDFCFKTFGYHESLGPSVPIKPSGSVEGLSWYNYQYETVSTDPDGDEIRYGWDWDGDDIVDEWTNYFESGHVIRSSHYWTSSGLYLIRVKAEDEFGLSSSFSEGLLVNITNDPPETPEILSGDTVGDVGESYTYQVRTLDPDGDQIKYGWDWDGDDIVDEWTLFFPSGSVLNISHIWNISGTYYVKVRAQDDLNSLSNFSDTYRVIIVDTSNDPPNKPCCPIGPSIGRAGISYSFGSITTDPNGDRIYYLFDWDDGSFSNWIGPFSSGQPCNISHNWNLKGTFQVKVKAKDEFGGESIWSDPLAITMPKNNYFLFNRIIQYLSINKIEIYPYLNHSLTKILI